MKLTFFVPGIAKPAGSKRAFALRRGGVLTGRVAVTDDCKESRSWKNCVSYEAKQAATAARRDMFLCAVKLTLAFSVMRPKGHYGSGCNATRVKSASPRWPTVRPDVLKLARAIEDALTGIVWKDDSQVVIETISKSYAPRPGVHVTVESLEDEANA